MIEQSTTKEGKGKVAFIFGGVLDREVGMGHELYRNFASVKMIFDEADEALGFSISRVCFEGPEEELSQPSNTQPAVLVSELAILKAAEEMGFLDKIGLPSFLAGLSLGQLTSLVPAKMLGLSHTVRLVRERARLMYKANQVSSGTMAAIIGLDEAVVENICQEAGCYISVIYCLGNIVVGGAKKAVDKAMELAEARGAYRVILLATGVASHTPVMQPASEELARAISSLPFNDAVIPIVLNSTARPVISSEAMKRDLPKQILLPVQWQRSVEYMVETGVSTFVVIASVRGRQLADTIVRTNSNAKILTISNVDTIRDAIRLS